MKKQISKTQYETLALHATYDFNLEEGKDAGRLLCDIASNVNNISKLKNKTINSKALTSAITQRLLSIIKSRKFQSSLKSYTDDEINTIMCWNNEI